MAFLKLSRLTSKTWKGWPRHNLLPTISNGWLLAISFSLVQRDFRDSIINVEPGMTRMTENSLFRSFSHGSGRNPPVKARRFRHKRLVPACCKPGSPEWHEWASFRLDIIQRPTANGQKRILGDRFLEGCCVCSWQPFCLSSPMCAICDFSPTPFSPAEIPWILADWVQ